MRKQGPCFHCGIESTPLWRNGPPEKPVLCNACGSRYRLGKPLENYTPKNFHVIRNKKRKSGSKAIVTEKNIVESNACNSSSSSSSALEEDDASSESSTSHNQNCFSVKQEILDDNPVENWGSSWRIHSRKRLPVVYSSLTTIQKLQRDLHNVLRDEDRLNSIASEGPEDVLIYNVNINKLQIPSTEIGLGIVLLKFPGSSSCHQDQQEIGRSSNIPGKFASPLNQAQPANPPSLRFLGRKKKRCRILPQDNGEKD